jgi:ketosteroid isomerase-like protein
VENLDIRRPPTGASGEGLPEGSVQKESVMPNIEENKQVARRYLELIGQGDARGVADLFTDNGSIIVQSRTRLSPEVRGREKVFDLISGLSEIFPETGLRITVDEVTAEDNRVSIVAHSDAVHSSGKPYNNRYHFLLYIQDGKIAEAHEYMDSLLLTEVFFDGAGPEPE